METLEHAAKQAMSNPRSASLQDYRQATFRTRGDLNRAQDVAKAELQQANPAELLKQLTAMNLSMAKRPNSPIDGEAQLAVYVQDCSEWPRAVALNALEWIRRNKTFFPTAAEVMEALSREGREYVAERQAILNGVVVPQEDQDRAERDKTASDSWKAWEHKDYALKRDLAYAEAEASRSNPENTFYWRAANGAGQRIPKGVNPWANPAKFKRKTQEAETIRREIEAHNMTKPSRSRAI